MRTRPLHHQLSVESFLVLCFSFASTVSLFAGEISSPFATDTNQVLERTSFQTGKAWTPQGDLRSDVAIVYGIDTNLP
jgi:hypothetical protein